MDRYYSNVVRPMIIIGVILVVTTSIGLLFGRLDKERPLIKKPSLIYNEFEVVCLKPDGIKGYIQSVAYYRRYVPDYDYVIQIFYGDVVLVNQDQIEKCEDKTNG